MPDQLTRRSIEPSQATDDIDAANERECGSLRAVSQGQDGQRLLGRDEHAGPFELRVLSGIANNPRRLAEVTTQCQRIGLVEHPAVRKVASWSMDVDPPTLRMELPKGTDPSRHGLDRLLEPTTSLLTADQRWRIAWQIVDAAIAAHRVGLFHGSYSPTTLLVQADDAVPVWIDYTATICDEAIAKIALSVDDDLQSLQRLLNELLGALLEKTPEDTDQGPPSLSQWQSALHPHVSHEIETMPTAELDSRSGSSHDAPTSESDFHGVSMNAVASSEPTTRSSKEPPRQLGRFQLFQQVGEGGMGTVFRAIDLSNQETVAVKILRDRGQDFARSIRRFRKEARLMADAQNEHVTRLIEVGEDQGFHFLVMEFIDGVNLKKWLSRRPPLEEAEALSIAADISRALVDAHAREMVHRDIKPENVLIHLRDDAPEFAGNLYQRPLEHFVIKLTDFGIARHVHQSESMEVTRAGSVLGTPRYMSPEQCRSLGTVKPSSDVYSVGITMYELLTGTLPFEADDFMKIAAMHCYQDAPSIQKRNAKVSDLAAQIVQRAIAKDPADRFGDAGQLLSEILKLVHGQPTGFEAHPKLPDHSKKKVWTKTVVWKLASQPSELWPMVSNTERLNEAIGLPPVDYRSENDPILGVRKFGEFTLGGVKVSWEEHPFEWIEGRRMGILREFDQGPFRWFMSLVTLEPHADGGTRLSHQVSIESRNLLGRMLTTIEADWKGFKHLDGVYKRVDRAIQGRLSAKEGSDAFCKTKPLGRNESKRLRERVANLIDRGVDTSLANRLETILRDWSSQDLAALRPLAIADRMKVDGRSMTDACLIAATEGLLVLRWEVLCPTCRVAASTRDQLSAIGAHTHCEACDVDFQSNLGDSIEMVFQSHPEIREVNDGQYCIGGPEHSPHVVAQVRIESRECLELELDLKPGDYLLRGPRLPRTQPVRVQSTAAPSRVNFELSRVGLGRHTPALRAGRQNLSLMNDLDHLHVVRIERTIPRGDVITATMASANPLFRQLFPDQNFAGTNPIETETMSFVATCIDQIEELYLSMTEAEAYELIREHHRRLADGVQASGGAVVKTVGERMLACFQRREQAVEAADSIRDRMAQPPALTNLRLGIAVHCGPTLATTQNNQIDYFGATVRAVSAMPDLAGGDMLVSEPVYSDPLTREKFADSTNQIEVIDLPGTPGLRVKRIVTER
ncbi:protein kinase domain-containing protein [Neorhodopirellula pilleata]|uniref:Serine/threonine-protein kinase PrkC n=1 Tax=Neorhodopirellula pilleata TaxID=2714738 RepID=A0A5C6A2T9_9BACT|nr:protein kinase [Neorhodopirellula pilleata]TWT93685.1 Serine/threonine-protein kinase PrkC [Neorhodopirellula pilleata]